MSAFDEGTILFKKQPDLMLAEVARVAAKRYQNVQTQGEFLAGYQAARRQRDEYESEQADDNDQDRYEYETGGQS